MVSRILVVLAVTGLVLAAAGTENETEPDEDVHDRDSEIIRFLEENKTCSVHASPCKDGLLLPMWTPLEHISDSDKLTRAIIYLIAMVYFFLGVSIVSDKFMSAIEVITSQEKEITVTTPEGEEAKLRVKVWNKTVANLTLMALGSSAPEILLSIIEIIGNDFEAGDLGPSCIVGSAAYNLFIIIAISIYVVPSTEVRVVKEMHVFFLTAAWGVFAYIWLYVILSASSPGVVDIWEAAITFVFFIFTVSTSYIADKKMLCYKYLPDFAPVESERKKSETKVTKKKDSNASVATSEVMNEYEQRRQECMEVIREVREKNPGTDYTFVEQIVERELQKKGPKSKAFYRAQTSVYGSSANMDMKRKTSRRYSAVPKTEQSVEDNKTTVVFLENDQVSVIEDAGLLAVTVRRKGGDTAKTCLVDYRTQDYTAAEGKDYIGVEGTIEFTSHQTTQIIQIGIVDDDTFEENEQFYLHITNPRLVDTNDNIITKANEIKLGQPTTTIITIIDDDHPGIFHFLEAEVTTTEDVGTLLVKVARSTGAKGGVRVPYHCEEGTADQGKDFDIFGDEVLFENRELEKLILVKISDTGKYDKRAYFTLVLDTPERIEIIDDDQYIPYEPIDEEDTIQPTLGLQPTITIFIKEAAAMKKMVDAVLNTKSLTMIDRPQSWKDQFIEAITVNPDYGKDADGNIIIVVMDQYPTAMDYASHFVCLFWKLMFAFIPSTKYCNGWACFCVSILLIGFLTTIIGDLASSFGCTIGLKDSITAISLVAMGTSLPDTFASKVAALNEKYADAAIGNVNGSNAVNVFLGLGIAWTIAAIYHSLHGKQFLVRPGELAMSVTIFCILAFFAIIIIILRRTKVVGGELGGPKFIKIITAVILVGFWFVYLLISSLVVYCVIPGF